MLYCCIKCQKELASESLELHYIHCQKYMEECFCGAIISSKKLSEHLNKEHSNKKCKDCGEEMQAYLLKTHSCEQCQFCTLHLKASELPAHLEVCGNRTYQCEKCAEFIKFSSIETHKNCMPDLHTAASIRPTKKKAKKKLIPLNWVKVTPPRRAFNEDLLEELAYSEVFDDEEILNKNFVPQQDFELLEAIKRSVKDF